MPSHGLTSGWPPNCYTSKSPSTLYLTLTSCATTHVHFCILTWQLLARELLLLTMWSLWIIWYIHRQNMKHLVSRRLRVSLLSLLTAAFLSWWWRRRFKEGRQGLEPLLCVYICVDQWVGYQEVAILFRKPCKTKFHSHASITDLYNRWN